MTLRSYAWAALCGVAFMTACEDGAGPQPPQPTLLRRTAGNGQTGAPGQLLPIAYRVRVLDSAGTPRSGATVRWTARRGSVADSVTTTGPDGLATVAVTLAATAGADTVYAVSGNDSLRFVSLALTGPAIVAQVPVPANYGSHDTFVRSGLAFACLWNTGIVTYDVGGGMAGGGPAAPAPLDTIHTGDNGVTGGRQSHNAWWFHNPVLNEQRYLFVGQEGPGSIGSSSSGDIHVVDVSDLNNPVEVASYRMNGAGPHNFWMDEPAQILYAAYYNGGVVALDVSGTLSGDLASREIARIQPGGAGSTYVWGVQLHANGSLYAVDMLSGVWQLRRNGGTFTVAGGGNNVPERFSSDFWVHGNHIYSGTWGTRGGRPGNALKIWRLDADGAPALVDSIVTSGIGTVSDVQVSADGQLLVFSSEGGPNAGLYVFGLTDPEKPDFRWSSPALSLHTATIADMNGRRYVFAAKNPANPAMLVFDITGLAP